MQGFLLVMILFLSAAGVDEMPYDLQYPQSKPIGRVTVQPYDKLDLMRFTDSGGETPERYGYVWKAVYFHPPYNDLESYKRLLAKELLQRVGYHGDVSLRRQSIYRLDANNSEWLYLDIMRDRYVVKLLREASYPQTVFLDSNVSLRYSDRLQRRDYKVPSHPFIPVIEGFVVADADYKRLDHRVFRFGDEEKDVAGELWNLDYAYEKADHETVRRFQMLHNYRDLLRAQGAEVLYEDDIHLLFKAENTGTVTWGEFGCNDIAAKLYLVREKTHADNGLLSAEMLKKALDTQGEVTLPGIYFDTGKATLRQESNAAVMAAGVMLKRYPDLRLEIEGHTDNVGGTAFNMTLSQSRADAVKAALVKLGVEASRLQSVGYGFDRPVAGNDDEAGRAKNRRVVLRQTGGGHKKIAIDASFFKPLRDAEAIAREYAASQTKEFFQSPPYAAEEKSFSVTGETMSVRYVFLKEGKRDRSISAFEILNAFAKMIRAFDGELLFKDAERADFLIRKGAGDRDVYGSIEAAMGAYRMTTVKAGKIKRLSAEQNASDSK